MRRRSLRSFFGHNEGLAVVEFAMTAPVLLALFMGGFEVSRFVLINHKLEKVTYTITDVVAQSTSVTSSQLGRIMSAATEIMDPYPFNAAGRVIVSSVYQNGTVNPPTVRWAYAGGGTLTRTSQIGTVNNNASLPAGLTLLDRDNVIVTEVYYRFTPFFNINIIPAADVYKTAIFKPRLGALTTTPN